VESEAVSTLFTLEEHMIEEVPRKPKPLDDNQMWGDTPVEIKRIGGGFDINGERIAELTPDQLSSGAVGEYANMSKPFAGVQSAFAEALWRRNLTTILRDALTTIAKWELPETGLFFEDDKTRPMSYEASHGSEGAKRYMRAIAEEALRNLP
jgi:hypothetical protein